MTIETETAVAAAYAIYKEHMVLLLDCITAWTWTNKRTWSIALELRARRALEELLRACSMIREGGSRHPTSLNHTLYSERTPGS